MTVEVLHPASSTDVLNEPDSGGRVDIDDEWAGHIELQFISNV